MCRIPERHITDRTLRLRAAPVGLAQIAQFERDAFVAIVLQALPLKRTRTNAWPQIA